MISHIGSTLMNTQSSRSHAVFTLNISQTTEYGKTKFARLHIIDLAGSESQKKTETSGNKNDIQKNPFLFSNS